MWTQIIIFKFLTSVPCLCMLLQIVFEHTDRMECFETRIKELGSFVT